MESVKQNGNNRNCIKSGLLVEIIQKQDQRTGKRTRGVVANILTNSPTHPHGIKVRLKDGKIGRIAEILQEDNPNKTGSI